MRRSTAGEAIASLLLPGLGQVCQRRYGAALLWVVLTLGAWTVCLGWVMHVLAAVDAALWRVKDEVTS